MRSAIRRGVFAGTAALLLLDAIVARTGIAPGILPRAATPWPWTASRAASVSAYLALTFEILFGLFLSTGAADRWIARARSVDLHRWLSSVSLSLVTLHVIVLVADRSLRLDALDLLIPGLAPYRPRAIALGIVAVGLGAIVHVSFALRPRIGPRVWRRLHYLSFAVFVFATAHGLAVGTDARFAWMRTLFLVASASVGAMLLVRWRVIAASPDARAVRSG
jgi:predicted ferric reductase